MAGNRETALKNLSKAGTGRKHRPETIETKLKKSIRKSLEAEFNEAIKRLLPEASKAYELAIKQARYPRMTLNKKGDLVKLEPGAFEHSIAVKAADSISSRLLGTPKQSVEHSGGIEFTGIEVTFVGKAKG